MNNKINELTGANMDIDLTTDKSDISWVQATCPWNKEEGTNEHKCCVKNTSICKYFCGIKYLDKVLCSYPYECKEIIKETQD